MTPLRALAFTVLYYGWSFLLAVLCLPLLLTSRRVMMAYGAFWARSVFLLLRLVVGLKSDVRGVENLPDGPALIVAKHQSTWDVLTLVALRPDAVFVLKQELTWIPLFGWYLLYSQHIAVNRGGGAAALKDMVKQARRAVALGRPIIIFPEGTRVPPGETRPYHPGAAALYTALGLEAVPIALNSGLFWPKRQLRQRGGTVTMEVLPPIPAGLDRKAFAREVETRLEAAGARLVAEARGAATGASA